MARLQNQQSLEETILLPVHVFGRQPGNTDTCLPGSEASRLHASISWDGQRWALKDSSTNGTYINGMKVAPNRLHTLRLNDVLHFGKYFGNISGDGWKITNLDAPCSMLVPVVSGLPILQLKSILQLKNMAALPSEDEIITTVYPSSNGCWLCESDQGIAVLRSGDLVAAGGKMWRFVEVRPSIKTQENERFKFSENHYIKLHFFVSQNEEHVSLTITINNQTFDLGERSHHYLILQLARKKLADDKASVDEKEQGWLDRNHLCKMLGLDVMHLNTQCYRFRKQVADLISMDAPVPQIIEARVGELRIHYAAIEIEGGLKLAEHKQRSLLIAN